MPGLGEEPKVIVTTSRRPSPRSRSLVKDLVSVIPRAVRLVRGHNSYADLAREAIRINADRVVVIGERKGNPGIIRVYEPLRSLELKNIVTFIVAGVKLAREAKAGRPENPQTLVVEADGSEIAEEFAEAMIRAFHAKLKPPGRTEDYVTAKIEKIAENTVRVTFYWRESLVGPTLKLRKPQVMVKDSERS